MESNLVVIFLANSNWSTKLPVKFSKMALIFLFFSLDFSSFNNPFAQNFRDIKFLSDITQ
jgi:hypothetical protein